MMPMLARSTTFLVLFGLLCSLDSFAAESLLTNSWRYTERAEVRPIARSIGLSEDPPQDFKELVTYRGTLQRYAQLRYGSENSRRVVIVVDELDDDLAKKQYDIYVDRDRDRILTSDELLNGNGRVRSFHLNTEIITEDQSEQAARRVELKLGVTGNRMSIATVGFIEGVIPWSTQDGGDEFLHVRRVDGSANGLFADSRDRLFFDLDGNEEWNRITEQFAFLPVLKLNGRRFAVRSDRLGERFALSEIKGIGKLRVNVASLSERAKIIAFEAMVFSEDGSAYSLKELNQPLEVPVGRYTLGSVTMTIDNGAKDAWHFVFSRSDSIPEDAWTAVEANTDVAIEAIGKTQFSLGVGDTNRVRAGDNIRINPTMHTERGLLINLSSRGRLMGSFDRERFHNCCLVSIATTDGKKVGSAKSGFA